MASSPRRHAGLQPLRRANLGGAISGTGAVTQIGAGTTILTGANTYSGSTTISTGTLQIGAGGTSGTLGTGAVVDNATLQFNRSDTLTFSNVVSGTGALTRPAPAPPS